MKLTIPNLDAAIKAMADEDIANWDQQCPREHYEALLQAAWNTICIATDDVGDSFDIAPMFRSKLFQKFLSQGFWHAHHVDLVWRMDGKEVREEADWLKDLWYFVRGKP